MPVATYILGGLVLTVLAAHLSYEFVERPLMSRLASAQRDRRKAVSRPDSATPQAATDGRLQAAVV
jgi:peptidoglycan/LPS O-acetylase OafA/YrhL